MKNSASLLKEAEESQIIVNEAGKGGKDFSPGTCLFLNSLTIS
jgi:hypothetical protein